MGSSANTNSNNSANGTEPIFFYSTERDLCSARGFTFAATNNTDRGDVCAYIDRAPERGLWACPAGNDRCWTVAKPCLGGEPTQPGADQTQCEGGGDNNNNESNSTDWCCSATWETCSTDTARPAVCLAKTFTNPLAAVDGAIASQIARNAVLASQTAVMLAVPTALSAQASTTDMVVPGINSIAPAASASFTVVDAFNASASTTSSARGAAGASTTSVNSMPAMPSSRLAGGAIAGITVAAVGVALLAAIVAFFTRKRRKQLRRGGGVHPRNQPSESNTGLLAPLGAGVGPTLPPPSRAATTTTTTREVFPVDVRETRPSEMDRLAPEQDTRAPLDDETMIAALEPSPLQTLMIHGRYPNR